MKKRQAFAVKPVKKRDETEWFDIDAVERHIDLILGPAQAGRSSLIHLGPLAFFSSDHGDAWMIDPVNGVATPLCREFEPCEVLLIEMEGDAFQIGWSHRYRIEGDAFVVRDKRTGGVTSHEGYPLPEILGAQAIIASQGRSRGR